MALNDRRARVSERFACDIAVKACTTLENREARIADLSRHGAQVRMEEPYEPGTPIHLDLDGDLVWGTVAWAEVDRIGMRFAAPLADGHALSRMLDDHRRAAIRAQPVPAAPVRGFGRRTA